MDNIVERIRLIYDSSKNGDLSVEELIQIYWLFYLNLDGEGEFLLPEKG